MMRIAERLYTQGLNSYPGTESNIFLIELNLTTLVEQQVVNLEWNNSTKFAGFWNNFQTRKNKRLSAYSYSSYKVC